ncbi:hypothetical protein HN51_041626 [Arachis hypogaea]|uniref:PWWP domain-containing protein n=1 Tax=Arachis hypogaea TaxID=3818 RepID=A0A444YTC6_ARAHY|nr:uncharacterized protein LOC107605334 [Arachis ipaensis]XP_016162673.1 uncharacterized protein LOC107605334 [Arachis ipaensis]XP_016162674.1 uncharacterized protein LOC107605335 [Arachis ipaensis]XP_016162675.1 uncharacterized protein LOC107605335 [Arachis ipaensis]XP_025658950.1 uncharacterized protein LOC112755217 [Arachis hypogaea]XP_025658951.1 uncharacterized protein LOC112755217 [Arachis hypogaea]QHN87414.1 Serine/threonine-protein kinase ATM [Arachis hypogaea]QHN87415.1 Serine/threo
MGTVETPSKNPAGCSSPSPENDKNELREALCALKGGAIENGVGFSSHGSQGDDDDGGGGGVELVKNRVRCGSVGREVEDGCQGLADSEMNGVSSLLKMKGSGRRLTYSFGSDSGDSEKLNYGSGGSFGVGMERGRKYWKRSEEEGDQFGKIVSKDVPVTETSENRDLDVEDLGEEGHGFSVGDFVWGKIKSHPWWPGQIYDPSDASDFALKLRQKNRLLVAYFGDGTFAWCHPSQLKLFRENFQDMVKQSSSRSFVNAVQEAVNEVGRLVEIKTNCCPCASEETRSDFALPLAKNAGIKEGVLVPGNGVERFLDFLINPAELLSRVKQIAEIIAVTNTLDLEILKARLSAFHLARGGYKLPKYEEPLPVPGLEDSSMDERVDVGNIQGGVEAHVQGPSEDDYSTVPTNPESRELSYSHEISGHRSTHRIKQKSIAEILRENEVVSTKSKEEGTMEKMKVKSKRKSSEDAVASKPLQKRKESLPSTDRNLTNAANDVSIGKVKRDKGTPSQLKEKKEAFGNENNRSGRKKKPKEGNPKEQNEKGSLSRERKKSKYLSPPFTAPAKGQRKEDLDKESHNDSDKAHVSEAMPRAGNQFHKSPEPPKFNGEAVHKSPESSNYQTSEDNNKVIDPAKVETPAVEVLSKVRHAAINPLVPGEISSLENFVDFVSVFRSSLYQEGSYYKVYKKHQRGRKRKNPESELRKLKKDEKQTNQISPNDVSEPRKRRRKETMSGVPEDQKQAAEAKAVKGSDENVSSVALLVSFEPGSSLPSKSDLITLYSKFGALNESATTVFSSNYSAQVSFLKASDAKIALNHSQSASPFGSSKVRFKLSYLSAESKSAKKGEKSKSKASQVKEKDKTPTKPSDSLSPKKEASQLNHIKQKLEYLSSILEASNGKSQAMETKLKSGIKELLEDVNKMVDSSSS